MRVTDYTNAIVREPAKSVVNGLRDDKTAVPTLDGVVREHRAYIEALRSAGLTVDVLPPLEAFPDSVFVEDPALLFSEFAVLLRPGAASRMAERDEMRPALARHFERVVELGDDEFVDGGDILQTSKEIFIGLSKRTTRKGAEALSEFLRSFGFAPTVAQTPDGILHFKTASALLDDETVIATRAMAASGVFAGYKVLLVPEGEEAAANLLRVNDVVLVGDRFPRTIDLLAKEGFKLVPLAVTEINKLDAGLSCMSLRWAAPA
jgi:dimethylargininase